MSDNCGCTCTPDPTMVAEMVKSTLYSEMSAGNIQPPLYDTNGQRLGQATVMTAAEVRSLVEQAASSQTAALNALAGKVDALGDKVTSLQSNALQSVSTDASLAGQGTQANPLKIASDWLKQVVGGFFASNGSVVASRETTTDSVSTVIIGDPAKTMGAPVGFIPHPTQSGYGIPIYGVKE